MKIVHFFMLMIFLVVILNFVSTEKVNAEVKWITLQTESGESVRAIYGYPDSGNKHPAVIYNHGTKVRRLGYDKAASTGYDVKSFVESLVKSGYVSIAPIRQYAMLPPSRRGQGNRDIMSGSPQDWTEAIKEGLRVIKSASNFLKERPNIDNNKIGIIGFSEGGLITLWSSFDSNDVNAFVLISPANIDQTPEYNFKKAVKTVEKITSPVFLLLGEKDKKVIISNCTNFFIPKMKELNKNFEYKTDYPGDHSWFWIVRNEYWNDVIRFLNTHLIK